MQNLDIIAKELFNKIRGRFPSVTIGDGEGNVTNEPEQARYFDFDFVTEGRPVGKVSISLDDNQLAVVYGKDLVDNEDDVTKSNWYDFLKELRMFAKKRMMTFDTRDITKSNLNSRDYKFLATNRSREEQMSESKLYGTSKTSYQDVGTARLMFKHSTPVNQELPAGRTQNISNIYIESSEGERFKYPYRHIAGARAMARHVAEGGKPFDDFGSHITGLSEELSKLRKFKTYMNRSSVMAESLAEYMDVVNERIQGVKKTIERIQKPAAYKEAFDGFEKPVFEDVPDDVKENWIEQLTIRQFNEELADVFPYIYKLVGEATRAKDLGPDDLVSEDDDPCWKGYKQVGMKKKNGKEVPNCVPESDDLDESGLQYHTGVKKHGKEYMKKAAQAGRDGASQEELGRLRDKYSKAEKQTKEDFELEQAFEDAMGHFSDSVCEECGNPSWRTFTEAEKQKGLDGKACWKGYRRQGTKMKGGKRVDNCVKVGENDADEGNAYAHAVRQAKMNGKKKGDKVQGPDGDEITLEKDKKTPLGEFILSYFDRETGQFPKGETAVLTMIEKDYGDEFIEPAKQFIEQVNNLVAEQFGYKESEEEYTVSEQGAAHGFKKGDLVRFKGKDQEFEIAGLAGPTDDPDTVYIRKPGTTPTQGAVASTLEPAKSAEPAVASQFNKGDSVEYMGKPYTVYAVDKDDPNTLYLQAPGEDKTRAVWAGGGDVKATESNDMIRMRELAGLS